MTLFKIFKTAIYFFFGGGRGAPNFPELCNHVRLELAYSATKASMSLQILDIVTTVYVFISRQGITKGLIRIVQMHW